MSLLYALPLRVASCVMRHASMPPRSGRLARSVAGRHVANTWFPLHLEARGARRQAPSLLHAVPAARAPGRLGSHGGLCPSLADEALVVAALSDAHSILSRATTSSDDAVLRARYEQRDCIVVRGLGGSLSAACAGACRWSSRRPFARARTGVPLPAQLAAAAALARLEEPSPSRASRSTRSAASARWNGH